MEEINSELYNDLANLGHNMSNFEAYKDATIEDLCISCVRNVENISDPLYGYCLACVNSSNYLSV